MNGMLVNNAFEFCKLFVSLVCSRNKFFFWCFISIMNGGFKLL